MENNQLSEWEKEFEKLPFVRGLDNAFGGMTQKQKYMVIKEFDRIKSFVRSLLHQSYEQGKKETIENLLPHLYSVWANIALTQGKKAREMMKDIIDDLEKE